MEQLDKYSDQQIRLNQYHARKTTCYKGYVLAGGSGSRKDYDLFCEINQIKAIKLEAILESN